MPSRTVTRRLAVNIVLLALAVFLIAIAVFEPGQDEPPEKPVIATMDSQTINRIVIERPDEPPVRMEKQDGDWRMTAPRSLPAAPGKLDKLLRFPGTTSQRRYAVTELNPAGLGLGDDSVRLRLNDTWFAFGDTDAINGWRYVRVADTVHLVEDSIYYNLRQDPLSWVSTRLLPEDAKITALRLPKIELSLQDGVWQASQASGGADAIVALIQRWQRAHALSVHPLDEKAKYSGTVRVSLADGGEPIVFKLIELDTGFELAREDLKLKYRLSEFQYNDLMDLNPNPSN